MKVLYIVQHFNVPSGTAGIRPYKMAKALIESGHEVTIVCGSYDGAQTGLNGVFAKGKRIGYYEGIKIIEFDIKYSNKLSFVHRIWVFFKYVWKTIGLALFYRYDILFASSTPLTVGISGIFAKCIRKKKFVFEVRDLWPELPKAMKVINNPIILALMSFLEYISYHSADKLIGLSEGITNGIAKKGIPLSKIETIPNGCDLDIFQTSDEKFNIKGIFENDFLCLYSGTHGIANGLEILIDVAIILRDRGNSTIKFILVGDGRCKSDLIDKVRFNNLSNIIFLEPLNKRELSKLMNTCDLGMQLLANIPEFYFGTSPNKFFDYISIGLPVLNNYPGWISDLIENNNCGIKILPDNPEEFASKLIFIEKERFKLDEMSKNAKALANSNFDRNILSKKWVDWVIN